MITIPLGLRTALESGQAVLFVGAGVGACASDKDGNRAPDAWTLAGDLVKHFSINPPSHLDLAQIAQVVEIRHGREELEAFLAKRLDGFDPNASLRWLCTRRWRAIFTTNYDSIVQRSFEMSAAPYQVPITISVTSDLVYSGSPFEVPIYHLHGALFTSPRALIVTENDYARFRTRRAMLFELLKRELATSTILYVGYSNSDQNWKMVLAEIRSEFAPARPPQAYRLAPFTEQLSREVLGSQGVETIDADIEEFAASAASVLDEASTDQLILSNFAGRVPSHLAEAFSRTPGAVARLIKSWTYVNQAPFEVLPNLSEFLNGDLPNWSIAARRIPFERDAAELLYDDLLDFATAGKPRATVQILLGSAGSGISTLLMTTAARLVEEKAGRVFFLRSSVPLIEGDIIFAASLFSEPCFFFVDNASDESSSLQLALARLREQRIPACLVLGERINEWRQARSHLRGKEHFLGDLSDGEIDRLLDFLGASHALNKLANLDRGLQAAAVRERHGKQLLVTMREATENESFDAIIYDEYRNMENELARSLYAAVSCFSHLRCFARDEVVGKILCLPLEELFRETSAATEGVIFWETVDPDRGIYAARTRHHLIASIIWQRCLSLPQRDDIVLNAVKALNINYHSDLKAFDAFVRSDEHVEGISTFDGKVKFFEAAAKKDPRNPYVLQHYARMLLREERLELALGQIDRAIAIAPNGRVLYHTRGKVLAAIALSSESEAIGRRRLFQSEAAFRKCRNMGERDPYPYQGLAELYFGWAKKCASEDEAIEYIERAENEISEGLGKAQEREGLWIVSSQIHEWLGNRPKSEAMLSKAIGAEPSGSVARYLLGKMLRRRGRYSEALTVLRPLIEAKPEDFRACLEYVRCLLGTGGAYSEAIGILRLSVLYGRGDPRFVAYLGGMLFLDGKFTEAQGVFDDAKERNFTFLEARKPEFFPRERCELAKVLRLEGTIVSVRPGFAFFRTPGYPHVFFHGSKIGSWILEVGQKVAFQIAFSATGQLAREPTLVG